MTRWDEHMEPQTPVLRYSEGPDICDRKSGSSEYLRTGVG